MSGLWVGKKGKQSLSPLAVSVNLKGRHIVWFDGCNKVHISDFTYCLDDLLDILLHLVVHHLLDHYVRVLRNPGQFPLRASAGADGFPVRRGTCLALGVNEERNALQWDGGKSKTGFLRTSQWTSTLYCLWSLAKMSRLLSTFRIESARRSSSYRKLSQACCIFCLRLFIISDK